MEDGGYFAIIGFGKQFQESLKEILDAESETDEIILENNEDLETQSKIIQVKYHPKSTQNKKTFDNVVKKLFHKFCNNEEYQNRKIFLYAHYKQESKEDKEVLDILKNNEPKEKIEAFNQNFKYEPIENFENAQKEIFGKLKEVIEGCNDDKIQQEYYDKAISIIIDRIAKNTKKEKRKITKKELIELLKLKFYTIYHHIRLIELGLDRYCKDIKEIFENFEVPQFRLFIIDSDLNVNNATTICRLIAKKFNDKYRKRVYPFVYFPGLGDTKSLSDIKKALYDQPEKITFVDGHVFLGSDFTPETLRIQDKDQIKLRFLNCDKNFKWFVEDSQILKGFEKEIYHFRDNASKISLNNINIPRYKQIYIQDFNVIEKILN